ncbi:hypothetical protein GF325_00910 [Candidatus Bathyarchaeota archaeon]|nr:hypothetical protein [Candidatus Bathyarchaeota archaeon]
MQITFLGTGAAEAYPGLFCTCMNCEKARELGGKNLRCRSSAVVNDDLFIDFGPDASAQATRFNVNLAGISDFLFTHSHWDHLAVHDMFFRSSGYRRNGNLDIATLWGNEESIDAVLDQLRVKLAKEFTVPGDIIPTREETRDELVDYLRLNVRVMEPRNTREIGRYTVHALDAMHKEPEKTMNFIIDDGTAVFLYATDTGPWGDDTWSFLDALDLQLDVVALDCTVGHGIPGGHHSYDSFLAEREGLRECGVLKEDTIFLAHHFSHQDGLVHNEVVDFMEHRGIKVTHDGLVIIRNS